MLSLTKSKSEIVLSQKEEQKLILTFPFSTQWGKKLHFPSLMNLEIQK